MRQLHLYSIPSSSCNDLTTTDKWDTIELANDEDIHDKSHTAILNVKWGESWASAWIAPEEVQANGLSSCWMMRIVPNVLNIITFIDRVHNF